MRPTLLLRAALLLALLVPGGCKDRPSKGASGPVTPPTADGDVGSEAPRDDSLVGGPPRADVGGPSGPNFGAEAPPTGDTDAGPEAPRADVVPEASRADSGRDAPPTVKKRRPTPPKVNHLITVADLVGVLATRGWVSEGPIPGVSPQGDYNSILYTRPGSTQMVGVRIWEYRQHREAVERWNALLATHPNAEATEAVVRDTFFWTRGSLSGLVFLEADRSRVVGVSCHNELCNDTQLLQLAAIAHGRAR